MANPVTHWQLVAKDPEKAAAFYGTLFDWKIDSDNALGYRMVATGDGGLDGGIWPSPPEGHSLVQLYVQVDDVTATATQAVELGAHLVVPPQTLPGGDQMAILVDPQGIAFGVTKPA